MESRISAGRDKLTHQISCANSGAQEVASRGFLYRAGFALHQLAAPKARTLLAKVSALFNRTYINGPILPVTMASGPMPKELRITLQPDAEEGQTAKSVDQAEVDTVSLLQSKRPVELLIAACPAAQNSCEKIDPLTIQDQKIVRELEEGAVLQVTETCMSRLMIQENGLSLRKELKGHLYGIHSHKAKSHGDKSYGAEFTLWRRDRLRSYEDIVSYLDHIKYSIYPLSFCLSLKTWGKDRPVKVSDLQKKPLTLIYAAGDNVEDIFEIIQKGSIFFKADYLPLLKVQVEAADEGDGTEEKIKQESIESYHPCAYALSNKWQDEYQSTITIIWDLNSENLEKLRRDSVENDTIFVRDGHIFTTRSIPLCMARAIVVGRKMQRLSEYLERISQALDEASLSNLRVISA